MSDGEIKRLAREIHTIGGTPLALPIGQAFTMRGTFRVYFNRHQAAPLVWCIATDSLEIAVGEVAISAPARTVYAPKATPDYEDGRPSAWLEVTGLLTVAMVGGAVIEADRPIVIESGYQSPA